MGRPPSISREQVLQTARALFIQKGFAATTLADIGRRLDVTPAALLRHAHSKQALFDEAMRQGETIVPAAILDLQNVDAAQEPRAILRRVARETIPFFVNKIQENISVYVHTRSLSVKLPIEPDGTPPASRALAVVENYFRRAKDAGRISAKIEPRAAAHLFIGSLQSYVLVNYVIKAEAKPYPIDKYIDALVQLWTEGAIVNEKRTRSPRRTK